MEKRKHKKPKKLPTTHQAMTGFEEAFQQFATSAAIGSKNTEDTGAPSGSPPSPVQSYIPSESKMDVSVASIREVHPRELDF